MSTNLAALGYLVAAVCFILALRGLSSPASSRTGNRLGMVGMAIAVVITLLVLPHRSPLNYLLILVGIAIGGGIGFTVARRIEMTAMPQLVAAFHRWSASPPSASPRAPSSAPPSSALPVPTA